MWHLLYNWRVRLPKSLSAFVHNDATGGIIMLFCTILALILQNGSYSTSYRHWLEMEAGLIFGDFNLIKPLLLWINDGLITIFFFSIGLELKIEFVKGHLSNPRNIILPAMAAVGGIIVPSLCFIAFNYQDPFAMQGWAIPASTDTAFAVALLLLLGSKVPGSLKIFLLSMAIFDDIGAILLIALFYTNELSGPAIISALFALICLCFLNFLGVGRKLFYLFFGVILWFSIFKSGMHATLAGIITAFCIPMQSADGEVMVERIFESLKMWVALLVLPIFTIANAGIDLSLIDIQDFLSPVSLGIFCGLFLGKQLGIFGMIWLCIKMRLAKMPEDATYLQIYGVCILTGIGFSMSMFIDSLAYKGSNVFNYADSLAILVASLCSGILGYTFLRFIACRTICITYRPWLPAPEGYKGSAATVNVYEHLPEGASSVAPTAALVAAANARLAAAEEAAEAAEEAAKAAQAAALAAKQIAQNDQLDEAIVAQVHVAAAQAAQAAATVAVSSTKLHDDDEHEETAKAAAAALDVANQVVDLAVEAAEILKEELEQENKAKDELKETSDSNEEQEQEAELVKQDSTAEKAIDEDSELNAKQLSDTEADTTINSDSEELAKQDYKADLASEKSAVSSSLHKTEETEATLDKVIDNTEQGSSSQSNECSHDELEEAQASKQTQAQNQSSILESDKANNSDKAEEDDKSAKSEKESESAVQIAKNTIVSLATAIKESISPDKDDRDARDARDAKDIKEVSEDKNSKEAVTKTSKSSKTIQDINEVVDTVTEETVKDLAKASAKANSTTDFANTDKSEQTIKSEKTESTERIVQAKVQDAVVKAEKQNKAETSAETSPRKERTLTKAEVKQALIDAHSKLMFMQGDDAELAEADDFDSAKASKFITVHYSKTVQSACSKVLATKISENGQCVEQKVAYRGREVEVAAYQHKLDTICAQAWSCYCDDLVQQSIEFAQTMMLTQNVSLEKNDNDSDKLNCEEASKEHQHKISSVVTNSLQDCSLDKALEEEQVLAQETSADISKKNQEITAYNIEQIAHNDLLSDPIASQDISTSHECPNECSASFNSLFSALGNLTKQDNKEQTNYCLDQDCLKGELCSGVEFTKEEQAVAKLIPIAVPASVLPVVKKKKAKLKVAETKENNETKDLNSVETNSANLATLKEVDQSIEQQGQSSKTTNDASKGGDLSSSLEDNPQGLATNELTKEQVNEAKQARMSEQSLAKVSEQDTVREDKANDVTKLDEPKVENVSVFVVGSDAVAVAVADIFAAPDDEYESLRLNTEIDLWADKIKASKINKAKKNS